eukprot:gene25382-11043_t
MSEIRQRAVAKKSDVSTVVKETEGFLDPKATTTQAMPAKPHLLTREAKAERLRVIREVLSSKKQGENSSYMLAFLIGSLPAGMVGLIFCALSTSIMYTMYSAQESNVCLACATLVSVSGGLTLPMSLLAAAGLIHLQGDDWVLNVLALPAMAMALMLLGMLE